ncbi:hypothetical protein FQN60_005304 [Etheostoma spectabile]|uniref:Uncharacterized protein n=1 Tax=Etheostoma spectabile TaxID=54343 RepID=A0A5J5CA50_9PERO|nr:hypothetical protein FQN60_005304 [Etheostoma spectabile]
MDSFSLFSQSLFLSSSYSTLHEDPKVVFWF